LPNKGKFSDALLAWWKAHGRAFPWIDENDPYRILVSEVLLHRTRANQVAPVYRRLIERFPTIRSLAAAEPRELKAIMRPLGLFWRTKYLRLAAKQIVEDYGGTIPEEAEALKSLPGISDYIASAIRCFAFRHPEAIIDTNTVRILGRVLGIRVTESSRRSKQFYESYRLLLDPENPRDFNHAILDLGALVCKPGVPLCNVCPVVTMCSYAASTAKQRMKASQVAHLSLLRDERPVAPISQFK
jgi:A/G-specific adenine glycosylase